MGEKHGESKAEAAEEGPTTAVLKLDLHCEGCAKKVKKAVSHFEGVEKVKVDCSANKLTVTGNVDPGWLRERVASKTKKKVDLVSPHPKKDDKKADNNDKTSDKKTEEKKPPADHDKKPKEPPVITIAMKIKLHCEGCAYKVKRVVLKNIEGVNSVKTDLQKDLITVTGTMDVKELATYLQAKLKKGIEIVLPKKDVGEKKDEKESNGGDKKDAKSDAGSAKESKPDPSTTVGGGEGTKVEVNKLEYNSYNPQTYFAMPMYSQQSYPNQDYGMGVHHAQGYANYLGYPQTSYAVQYSQGPPPPPPTYLNINDQIFSDENPNGCSLM